LVWNYRSDAVLLVSGATFRNMWQNSKPITHRTLPAVLCFLAGRCSWSQQTCLPRAVNQYVSRRGRWQDSTFHFAPEWDDETFVNASIFWAYDCQVNSTEPVYRWWNTRGRHSTFHFAPAWDDETNASLGGPIFYAFPSSVPNIPTMAVEQYWDNKKRDSSTFHFPPGHAGETIAGTDIFYAFDNCFCGWPVGAASSRRGSWTVIGSSDVATDLSVSDGIMEGSEQQRTEQWGTSTTLAVEADFMFAGSGVKITVSNTWSHSVGESFTQSFQHTKSVAWTNHFPAGVYWQFQFSIHDNCGTASVGGHYVAVTNSSIQQPCCLPGFSVTPSDLFTCTSPEVTLPLPHCRHSSGGKAVNVYV